MREEDWTRLSKLIDERLDAAEDRIKYESPGGQKVAKRKWFEGFRKAVSK